MNRIVFAAAIVTGLTFGAPVKGIAAGGQRGVGGHSFRGGFRGSMTMRPATPRMASPRRPGGGPPVGTAVPRPRGRPSSPYYGAGSGWPYDGVYGGAFGLGLYGYDPLWDGMDASLYSYGEAYPFPSGDPSSPASEYATGGLRLDVRPSSAEVIVDGYLAGVVDEFNGHFQHLDLVCGPHHVEVRAPGYTSVQFDVNIEPHQTIKYHGKLNKP
jgi:hypothetical protein